MKKKNALQILGESFHKCREEESSWLEDDLEKYDIPILCCDYEKNEKEE